MDKNIYKINEKSKGIQLNIHINEYYVVDVDEHIKVILI